MWRLRWNATSGHVGKVRRPAAAGRTNLPSGLQSRSELAIGLVAPRRMILPTRRGGRVPPYQLRVSLPLVGLRSKTSLTRTCAVRESSKQRGQWFCYEYEASRTFPDSA